MNRRSFLSGILPATAAVTAAPKLVEAAESQSLGIGFREPITADDLEAARRYLALRLKDAKDAAPFRLRNADTGEVSGPIYNVDADELQAALKNLTPGPVLPSRDLSPTRYNSGSGAIGMIYRGSRQIHFRAQGRMIRWVDETLEGPGAEFQEFNFIYLPLDGRDIEWIEQVRSELRIEAGDQHWRLTGLDGVAIEDWRLERDYDAEPNMSVAVVQLQPQCPACGSLMLPSQEWLRDCVPHFVTCFCGHRYWARFSERQTR